ncbi:LemA family protein [Marinobacter sp. G11]|uniref:LemA family protein n=1 Tax=Marinobacter sp. G11 TaxID=2903522 RepID=UPI001E4249B0|nr:LemA family protein [Marinobacter sp. G11]MCE0758926.1 LemA family protein [Marinobacter sp. G11]
MALASTSGRIITTLIAIACLAGSWHLMNQGLEQMTETRQMQRLPATPLAALSDGPYLIEATVTDALGARPAPYSGTPAVFYRYRLQERYRDSDGDTRLRTLESGQWGERFQVKDATGAATVNPETNQPDVDWNLRRTFNQQEGDLIYSEWALRPGDTAYVVGHFNREHREVRFDGLSGFSLPALISTGKLETNGGERLFSAGVRISIATGLLALGLALALTALKIHRLWVYILMVTVGVSGSLAWLGVSRLNQEWSAIATLYESRYQQLREGSASPLVQADIAALEQLIRLSTSGWLDRWMFRTIVEERLPAPELDDQTAALAAAAVEKKQPARLEYSIPVMVLTAGAGLLALFLMYLAIKGVKLKRLIEAVPTSSAAGLSFGLSELKGQIRADEQYPLLTDPLKNENCVAFYYKVEERSGSDKDEKWKTIESRKEQVPFWLEDDHGRVRVYPEGATIDYPKTHTHNRGDRRYTVRLLAPDVKVYCLGFAGLDNQRPDRLSVQQDSETPFLISSKDEDDIVLNRGARSFVSIAASLGLFLFTATSLLAADGRFSPDNLLLSALMVPLVLCLYLGVLHYNDMVFLKNRVNRARANIDTILQQRHDLWPMLENTVKAAMAHEKQLMTHIASLRAEPPASMESTANVERTLAREQAATQVLKARIEDYPEMKNHEVVGRFMAIMADTESYLALLRNSYTDSAMIYNTRIQTLPDLLLAWLFRFRPVSQFSKDGS